MWLRVSAPFSHSRKVSLASRANTYPTHCEGLQQSAASAVKSYCLIIQLQVQAIFGQICWFQCGLEPKQNSGCAIQGFGSYQGCRNHVSNHYHGLDFSLFEAKNHPPVFNHHELVSIQIHFFNPPYFFIFPDSQMFLWCFYGSNMF